ncbi:MAG: S41 family peptidase [Emergencia sp.]
MIKMKKKKFILLICVVVIASLLAAGAGLAVFVSANDMVLVNRDDYKTLSDMGSRYGKLYSLQKTLENQFLYEIDEDAQMEAVYKAVTDALGDKYTSYMTEEEYEKWKEAVTGTFTGVGLVFMETENGDIVVTKVVDGGPADTAGLKAGDRLLKVDGKTCEDITDMASRLRGDEGTSLKLSYERDGKVKEVAMVRAQVEEPTVYSAVIDDRYGYIQILSFEQTTADQFRTELAEMEKKGVAGLVVDLRNNPGGLVDQGIEVADMLLPECTITHTEDKNGKKEYHNSDENCTSLRYVLLVNEKTASASEIIAAAVKDNGGGSLVGAKTFGKGIIQGTVEFKDGSAVKMTIMQYLSPKGSVIQGKGIEPDYKVSLPEDADKDLQLEKALKLLK